MPKNKRRHLQSKRNKFEAKTVSNASNGANNPFEFHRNKVKDNVIGRKLAKNEIGNKGLSRNRAFNKRKNTILHEYQRKHKSGRGVRHLTDKDEQLTREATNFGSSFGETTELTHKGQHLNEFIDDAIGSDDDDIDVFNRSEFVESAHFGGGSDGRPKSANEVLDQIMDEKREKQLERAANVELTKKLDSEWSAIKSILKHKGVKHDVSNTKEDFDILVKELMFDSRSKPIVTVQSCPPQTKISSNEISATQKSAKTLFKETILEIEQTKNWEDIMSLFKGLVDELLPQVKEESLSILIEKYQTIIESEADCLSPNSFTLVLLGTYFRQTQPLITLILTNLLSKLRYFSFKHIAMGLVLIKTLLLSSKSKFIPQTFVSILNIIGLTQNQIESTVKTKGKQKCSLVLTNVSNADNHCVFDPKYAFDPTFDNNSLSETQIKQMLILESLRIFDQMLDSYSSLPSLKELTAHAKNNLTSMSENSVKSISEIANAIVLKLNKNECNKALSNSRPKPFILPMFEPKFDQKASSFDKKNPKKKLIKKYKRELKGAQRELRKDSVFMRSTWIEEIQKNDQKRRNKVKQIMGDLAVQQGLYKKKKKG